MKERGKSGWGLAVKLILHSGCLLTWLLGPAVEVLPPLQLLESWQPPLPDTHTWTNGMFMPTFMKVLESWVWGLLIPKEEHTGCKIWA